MGTRCVKDPRRPLRGHMMRPMNAKIAVWVGAAMLLVGIGLGFVGNADCGSVFRGPDEKQQDTDRFNAAFMGRDYEPPDCSGQTDLTVPVWLLIAAGGVLFVVGGATAASRSSNAKVAKMEAERRAAVQETADSQDAIPSGNDSP